MLRTLNRWLGVLLLTTAVAGPAHADQALDQLVVNARYWQERGRADKAIEAWRRVLLADPNSVDALVELGTYHARRGGLDKTRDYLVRLRAVNPQHPGIATLERALATGSGYDDLVARARKLSHEGNLADAVTAYRQAIGTGDPPGDLALEYYQTLGGTPTGWEAAQKGLERLAGPTGTPLAKLAHAKHLTYREKSRRAGIAQLLALTSDPRTAEDAARAWRQALLWLQAGPADAELFNAYLAAKGSDPELARRLDDLKRTGKSVPSAAKAGFDALGRSDLDEAGRQFDRAAKARPNDPQALVGQGVVALQQKDFVHAKEIFTRVKALEPGKPELWERSLRSATFWTLMHEADVQAKANHLDEAERKLQEAVKVSPEERAFADIARVDLLREGGAVAEAETSVLKLLADDPKSVPALQAWLRLCVATSRTAEAEDANARIAAIDPSKAAPAAAMHADLLRGRAARAIAAGQLDQAHADLIEAQKADPHNLGAAIDLGYLEIERDDLVAARRALDSAGPAATTGKEALRLRVHILEAERHFTEALQLLGSVPAKDLDAVLTATKLHLEIRAEAAVLVARAQRGARAGSRLRLLELERRAGGKPDLALVVAEAWADAGDVARALLLTQQIAARAPDLRPGARLQLAAVYLRADRDPELLELLRDLATEVKLSRRERADLDRLRVARAVRHADRLRDKGDLEAALAEIAPLLRENSENPRLLCVLGRIYHVANENTEAFAVFKRVLGQDPDDLEARQGAVEAATSLHDRETARRLVDEALQRAPRDPRVHLLAGRFSALTGEDAAADDAFRVAQNLLSRDPATGDGSLALAMDRRPSDVVEQATLKLGARASTPSAASGERNLPLEVQTELDHLAAKKSIDVRADFNVRNRDGYGGFAGLTELRIPVTATIPLGFRGRIGLTATPVVLDSGDPNRSRDTTERFGSLGLDPTMVPQDGLNRTVNGAQLALSYTHRWLSLDIGSTPLGLPLQTVVGGASLRGQTGRVGISATAARRSVTDSVLSYVGMKDPATGATWGRVLSDGGRIDLSVDTEPALVYVFGGFARLTGKRTADNNMFMAGSGVEWALYDFDETSFVTGLGLTYLGYDKNLRYFTYGQGGYFSPQQFLHGGIPLKARGRSNAFRWEVLGDLGLNWFREEPTDYFPTNPLFQTVRASIPDTRASNGLAESTYPGQRNLSLALDFTARAAYQLTPQVEAGVQTAFRRADYFRELTGGLYVQFNFRRKLVTRPAGL